SIAVQASRARLGALPYARRRSVPVRSGHAPGRRRPRAPGAQRRARDAARSRATATQETCTLEAASESLRNRSAPVVIAVRAICLAAAWYGTAAAARLAPVDGNGAASQAAQPASGAAVANVPYTPDSGSIAVRCGRLID